MHGPRWTIDGNLDQTVSNPFEFKFFDKNLNVEIIMFDSFPADFSELGKEQFHLLGRDDILGKKGDHLFSNDRGEIIIIFVTLLLEHFLFLYFVKNVTFIF